MKKGRLSASLQQNYRPVTLGWGQGARSFKSPADLENFNKYLAQAFAGMSGQRPIYFLEMTSFYISWRFVPETEPQHIAKSVTEFSVADFPASFIQV